MKKKEKLNICNRSLLVLVPAILVSGIQLEATGCSGRVSVGVHIGLGLLFMIGVAYHIFLHFGKNGWFSRFSKLKNQATRILWWVWLITMVTGVATCIHWCATFIHTPFGGIHGILGFVLVALCAGHIFKRLKFFTKS